MATSVDNLNSVSARPIRPLPKRRLRSRLSEEANAALFIPPQQPAAPLFYFPYTSYTESAVGSTGTPGLSSASGLGDSAADSSDDEENSPAYFPSGPDAEPELDPIGSGDPYEWTENTNNKKKRKIPSHINPGGSSCSNGMSSGYGSAIHTSPGYSPTSSAPRNRLKPSQRSPLTSVPSNNYSSLRRTPRRYPPSPSPDPFTRKNPTSTTLKPTPKPSAPIAPPKSSTAPPKSSTPAFSEDAKFTFVCESPVSAALAYTPPSPPGGPSSPTPPSKTFNTQGTQTTPDTSETPTPTPTTRRKPKAKKLSALDLIAQGERRRRREMIANGGNKDGEFWICEFCEYQAIFGTPPLALMEQYEIKDRRERRKAAEKRRLLEKAKMKGKKGKQVAKKKEPQQAAPPPPQPGTGSTTQTRDDGAAPEGRSAGRTATVQTDVPERDRGGTEGDPQAGDTGGAGRGNGQT